MSEGHIERGTGLLRCYCRHLKFHKNPLVHTAKHETSSWFETRDLLHSVYCLSESEFFRYHLVSCCAVRE